MEKTSERRREPEPVIQDQIIENVYFNREEEKKRLQALPHVLKYKEIPWTQGIQAFHKHYTGGVGLNFILTKMPIYTLVIVEQIINPGGQSGRHRHYMEACFYVLEGRGYEIHDDKRWDWQAGDIFTVPTYCDHQHFNPDKERGVRLFYAVPLVYFLMGISGCEQIELHQDYKIPDGCSPLFDTQKRLTGYCMPDGREYRLGFDMDAGKVVESHRTILGPTGQARDLYDDFLQIQVEQANWRKTCPHVVKGSERPWENTRMGRIKYLSHRRVPSGLLFTDAFVQEIPPGGCSGRHRHVFEEVHKIVQGHGYDIHDGKRWDWEAEDIVCIPSHTEHQHFNSDRNHPATFFGFQSRLYDCAGWGGIEHLEDAPGAKS